MAGLAQAMHFGLVAQMTEAITNGLRRHGLQPKALDRVFVIREPAKIIEDKLAFAPGVAGINEKIDVFPRDEFLQTGEDTFRLVDRFEFEFRRNDGERFQPPEAVFLFVDVLGHQELGHVTHRG